MIYLYDYLTVYNIAIIVQSYAFSYIREELKKKY